MISGYIIDNDGARLGPQARNNRAVTLLTKVMSVF